MMKKTVMLLCAAALAVAAIFAVSCKKDSKTEKELTPEEVVTKAYNALLAKDYETFVSYLNETDEQKTASVELLKSKLDDETYNSIEKFSVVDSSIEGDAAKVKVWLKRKDDTTSEGNVALTKTADGWLIDSTDVK